MSWHCDDDQTAPGHGSPTANRSVVARRQSQVNPSRHVADASRDTALQPPPHECLSQLMSSEEQRKCRKSKVISPTMNMTRDVDTDHRQRYATNKVSLRREAHVLNVRDLTLLLHSFRGYVRPLMNWNHSNIPNQSGRHVIVTGANSGLGLETATRLAQAGASVTLACRNQSKADAAAKQIRDLLPDASVAVGIVDLADLGSVSLFAHKFMAERPVGCSRQ